MTRRNRTRERPEQATPGKAERTEQVGPPSLLSQSAGLKLLVFTAGAVLMGLEIAGSRVLAPYFGNSVFVWGSLISVFLVALSLGYFFGGHIADRHPSHVLLSSICVVVSILIFALALVSRGLCAALVNSGLGERGGPLVASMLLFLPPSVGMGMVSPFAIRLATQSVASVGKISGALYALSTAGSIAGTLLTTFVLVPLIGVSAILRGLGLVLLLVSLLTLPFWKRAFRFDQAVAGVALLGLLALACSIWPGSPAVALEPFDEIVVDVDTPYHHISVVDNQYRNSRQLRFDRYTESAIVKSPPYPSLARYTDYFHLAFLARAQSDTLHGQKRAVFGEITPHFSPRKMERTLFIGAGGGIGPRAFHMHDPEMAIDVVDIDPKVLELARTHFFLEDSPLASERIKTFAEDGRMFVRRVPSKYDCVILDAFSAGGRIPFHLVTREFLELCREKMTADGVFIMNINSAIDGPLARIFHSMYCTIDSVFPNTYAFAMKDQYADEHDPTNVSTNIILLATRDKNRISPQQWAVRARDHQSNSYITSGRMQQMVEDLLDVLPPDAAQAPIFSDDYAPIETMPF